MRCMGAWASQSNRILLPSLILNRSRRLLSNIVDNPVHSPDLVDDPAGDMGEELVGQLRPVRGHGVLRGHRPQRDDVRVRARIPHDADAPDREQRGEGLPYLVVMAPVLQLADEDKIRLPHNPQALFRDLSENPDGQPRPGEGMPADELLRDAQLEAKLPHLVLVELLERLDDPELPLQLRDFLLEGLDEGVADDLPLLFRVSDALQAGEEQL